MSREIDPGDAVPPGVAVQTPAPLTDQDRRTLDKLESIGTGAGQNADVAEALPSRTEQASNVPGTKRSADDQADREVELETQTVQPNSDSPSRQGITGSGSGADSM